ncbi:MAG: hypothetical protein JWP17_765 [Solirubrobacterales bacterium]|nr:hypothetical protein [Solirubrobacterales bacterium]
MHILMARADAESAAGRSGYSDEQRTELHARIAAGADDLSADDRRVQELAQGAHYQQDAASSRSVRAREMQEEFDRIFWGVEPAP